MATLQKGHTFAGSDEVTAEKLNNLVDQATISGIVNADIAAGAAIAHTKLANITSGRVLMGNSSNVPTATVISGDVTISNSGVTAIAAGAIATAEIADDAVTSAKIADGTIDNGNINASAAIALSKLATGALPAGITVASANLVDGTIVNADVSASAAIAGSKINPAFTANMTTTGTITASGGTIASGTIASVTDASSIVRSSRASTDVNGPQMDMRKARGTQAAKTVVASGDILGELRLLGYGGTSDHEGARIRATVDGTPGDNDMPTMLQFFTTADAAATVTERMRIKENGRVGINETSPASTLHVAGDLTVSSATVATAATAGANGDVPAQVVGYLVVSINGTSCKIPYYAT
jgi:hypothetical protein